VEGGARGARVESGGRRGSEEEEIQQLGFRFPSWFSVVGPLKNNSLEFFLGFFLIKDFVPGWLKKGNGFYGLSMCLLEAESLFPMSRCECFFSCTSLAKMYPNKGF
jgi:hypothetical protein